MHAEHLILGPNGWLPNNPLMAVRLYRGLQMADGRAPDASAFELMFNAHGWPADWRGGVYDYHHYHSSAHEVLGVYAGEATLVLGGDGAAELKVAAGDALLLPAGTGHRCLKASADFRVVGAYPSGQRWDLLREAPDADALSRIRMLPAPARDPVDGTPF